MCSSDLRQQAPLHLAERGRVTGWERGRFIEKTRLRQGGLGMRRRAKNEQRQQQRGKLAARKPADHGKPGKAGLARRRDSLEETRGIIGAWLKFKSRSAGEEGGGTPSFSAGGKTSRFLPAAPRIPEVHGGRPFPRRKIGPGRTWSTVCGPSGFLELCQTPACPPCHPPTVTRLRTSTDPDSEIGRAHV